MILAVGVELPSRMGVLSLDFAGNRFVRWNHDASFCGRQGSLDYVCAAYQAMLARFMCFYRLVLLTERKEPMHRTTECGAGTALPLLG